MKFLYCPKCKELRVKPWYSFRDRCPRCYTDVRVIDIPHSTLTYTVYATMAVCFGLLYIYSRNDQDLYLYAAIVFAAVMVVAQVMDLSRGEKYARGKIKVTKSDVKVMNEKRA